VRQAQDGLPLTGRQRWGTLTSAPCILLLPGWLVTERLFPAPLQLTRDEAVCRLDGVVLTSRPLCIGARPLKPLMPMGLSARACSAPRRLRPPTHLSRCGLEHLHDLRGDKAFEERSREAKAPRRTVITRGPHARVAQGIGLAAVCGHQAPPATPTHEHARQERGPCAGSASGVSDGAVVRQARLDRGTPLPADGGWKAIDDQHVAGLRGVDGPPGTASPRRLLAWIQLAMPPARGARVDGVVPHVLSGHARGPSPPELPPVWTIMGPHRHADVVGHQGAEPAMPTPVLLEGLTEQAEAPLGLRGWVQLIIAVGASDIPPGGMMQQCTAPRLVAHACQQTALHEGAFRFAHHPTQPSQ
jgi:hypothetical protein